jgi:hypothetical protein
LRAADNVRLVGDMLINGGAVWQINQAMTAKLCAQIFGENGTCEQCLFCKACDIIEMAITILIAQWARVFDIVYFDSKEHFEFPQIYRQYF